MKKRIALLGASGSIGQQTIDVISQHPDLFELVSFGVGRRIEEARGILEQFDVPVFAVQREEDAELLAAEYPDKTILCGDSGLIEIAKGEYDVLVNALVGFAGFAPTLAAIQSDHDVALANKETLVCGGELINRELALHGRTLVPIDSEHSAIFQCLQGNRMRQVKRLIVTASGGSFRNKTREELQSVTVEEALAHPNWSMGAKITIDSATMMNKGFEVTEAHWLFNVPFEQIDVLMHPESIVHSMVEYIDKSVMAQMGTPDMRLPIQYALSWPDRLELDEPPLDLAAVGTLHFAEPDFERFPLLALAYETGKKGGNLSAVMNAANEVANAAFRNHEIAFPMIEEIVISAVHEAEFEELRSAEDLYRANAWGDAYARERIRNIN
ncbi:MAG: 1-deoxy-D-xylulose-5-phosphate reductoisomerase [Solobacterium sp.]|nr:1-deoxy-D-xylulose-5-phosphate reductoisomerase [Solobacterium sp.]